MIITKEINMFREAARHLWNTYLGRGANWDTVDVFRKICLMLFTEQILSYHQIDAPPIPVDVEGDYLPQYRLFMPGEGKLPLYVNRELPPSGYWDYPVHWIPPEQEPDIRPICLFDFDLLGWRWLEYYRVRIVNCVSHPELTGRDALICCHHLEISLETGVDK